MRAQGEKKTASPPQLIFVPSGAACEQKAHPGVFTGRGDDQHMTGGSFSLAGVNDSLGSSRTNFFLCPGIPLHSLLRKNGFLHC